MQCATAPPLYKKNEQEASLLNDIKKTALTVFVALAQQQNLSQADLVRVAIVADPRQTWPLMKAYIRGWQFTAGQLGQDGLPLPGQLPRPIRGDRHG